MWLSDAIMKAATTVDRAHTPDAVRFNEREKQALLDHVARAEAIELESASYALERGAVLPAGESSIPQYFPPPRPVWLSADEPFRVQLREAVQVGVVTRSLGVEVPAPTPSAGGVVAAKAAAAVSGAGESAEPRFAVLLIDALYGGGTWADDIAREKQAMTAVLDRANHEDLPVFEITWPDEGFITDPELAAQRQRNNWVLVEKTTRDGFLGTNLAEELKARGITDVVVMGLYQDQCVEATVNTAVELGLRIHSGADLVQARPYAEDPTFRGWSAAPRAQLVDNIRDLPIF